MLTTPLTVGERRPALIKLVGYLRCRGIPEEVAVALVLPWAKTSFTEPLPAEEVERHIRGIYNRYGMPSPFRWRFGRSHPLRLEVQL